MTRSDYRTLDQLSITELEAMFAGYETLVDALQAQTHAWQRPVNDRVAAGKRRRGFARLFTFKHKVAKRR